MEKSFLGGFLEAHKAVARVYSLLLIGLSWMIFAITDFGQLGVYASRLVSVSSLSSCEDAVYYLRNYGAVIALGCLLSTPVAAPLFDKIKRKGAGIAVTLILMFVCVCFLTDASYNPFLYFRF